MNAIDSTGERGTSAVMGRIYAMFDKYQKLVDTPGCAGLIYKKPKDPAPKRLPAPPPPTPEECAEIVRLRSDGKTFREIQEITGRSYKQVRRILCSSLLKAPSRFYPARDYSLLSRKSA